MSTPALYKPSDYLAALQQLLPRGRAWPRDADATLTQVLSGLSQAFNDTDRAAQSMLTDVFPSTASTAFILDWLSTLAYTAIFGVGGTMPQRQAEIVGTLTDSGGQSISYLIGYAAKLGYGITIWQGSGGYTVDSAVDDALVSSTNPFTFLVNVPTGSDTTRLAAMLDHFKPAHTSYVFNFV